MTMLARNWTSVAVTSLATAAWLLLRAGTAQAATTAEYANWAQAGSSGAWTGTTTLSAAGFPVGALTSTSSALTIPTGASAFLSSDTPFGAVFGDSAGHPYANIGTATSQAPSTTTITFATPTPAAGWGFAVGDIDAGTVQIAATDTSNAVVPVAGLGWQSAFNYCATSPRPSSCTGPGPFTDQPTWDPGTATVIGSGTDTFGGAGWFEPTVALKSITFTFALQLGVPLFQLWLATLSVPLTGQVGGVTPELAVPAPGIELDLLHSDGTPVVDPVGAAVTATADDAGAFEFPSVVDGSYLLDIKPPPSLTSTGNPVAAVTVDVSTGAAAVAPGTFAVVPRAEPTPTPTPTPTATPTPRPPRRRPQRRPPRTTHHDHGHRTAGGNGLPGARVSGCRQRPDRRWTRADPRRIRAAQPAPARLDGSAASPVRPADARPTGARR